MRIASLATALVVIASGGCENPRALNEHPDVEKCKAATTPSTIATWTGGAIALRSAVEAAPECPAPKRVFVDANAGKGLRFVQIVEVSGVAAPDAARWSATADRPSTLAGTASSWTFLDASPDVRTKGEPFVNANLDGTFWDNPAWLDVPAHDERWIARSWAVLVDADDSGRAVVDAGKGTRTDATISAVGGFSWGWTWAAHAPMPVAVAPQALDARAWSADKQLLAKAFPSLHFE